MKRLLALMVLVTAVVLPAAPAMADPPAMADAPAMADVSTPSRLLNLGAGKVLGWNGEVAPPPGGALHLWVRVTHPATVALPGFSAPYQLRNPVTGLCLEDYGDGAQIVLTGCGTDPADDSPQLWQHHRTPDRIAHQRPFGFLFNRSTGRVLTAVPSTGTRPNVVVTVAPSGSDSAAYQLWTALAP
ncbi:RICIN domain-containing protein [Virgisporangium ochraceum]|uniref:RICIN domain-containing protein n=1 Tax=Virgisporangium ochraceum TaxID=65505 RepID=UPI0019459858|nr:hypothetical protein [Virgisporangium ochraceum]